MSAIDEVLGQLSRQPVPLEATPGRGLVVLTCMDARIDVFSLLGLRRGEVHVIRNAGGLATDDVLRSLLLSQRLLETREVMVIQHTGCGLLNLDEDGLKKQVRTETGADLPFDLGAFSDPQANVARTIDKIRSSLLLPHRDHIRGFVYDLDSGALNEVQVPNVHAN